MSNQDKEKLKKLLDYWIHHNREHSEEFKEWAQKTKGFGEAEISKDIMKAAKLMDEASAIFEGTLKKLGGRG